jgi:hypothetical protein
VIDIIGGSPLSMETIVLDDETVRGLNPPRPARSALLTIAGAVRFCSDGTAPTAEVGHMLSNERLILNGPFELIRFIGQPGARQSIVTVSYFK